MAQGHERPHAPDQHGTYAEITNLLRPQQACELLGRQACGDRGEFCVAGQHERGVDGNSDVPGQHRARKHDDADVETHDVADANQCGRQVGTEIGEILAKESRACRGVRDQAQSARSGELGERTTERRQAEDADTFGGVLAGFEDFRGGLAFREGEFLLHDQRAAQRYREQYAEDATETCDREHPGILEVLPVAEDHESRNGEDHAGGDR